MFCLVGTCRICICEERLTARSAKARQAFSLLVPAERTKSRGALTFSMLRSGPATPRRACIEQRVSGWKGGGGESSTHRVGTCSRAERGEDSDDDLSLDVEVVERGFERFDLRGEEVEGGEVEAARVHGGYGRTDQSQLVRRINI